VNSLGPQTRTRVELNAKEDASISCQPSDTTGTPARRHLANRQSFLVHDEAKMTVEMAMQDEKFQTRTQDMARINLGDTNDLADWCEKFGVSEDQLKSAVAAVGDKASRVRSYLQARE